MSEQDKIRIATLEVLLSVRANTSEEADDIMEQIDPIDLCQYLRRQAQAYLFSQGGAVSGVIVEVEGHGG